MFAQQKPYFKAIYCAIFLIFLLQFFSKSASAALTLTISGAPGTIGPDEEFGITIDYQSSAGGTDYYLQVSFTSPGETKYFGQTQDNDGVWHTYGESFDNFYKITTNGDGDWNGTIRGKPDTTDSDYKGEGSYILKVKRFTSTGGSYTWSNELTISIQDISPSPSPSPSPSSSSSPSPSPSPSSSNATYKINEVKDTEGNVLSSVKVYVDEVYLHHYAPEALTFCDGCRCDDLVDCGFGEHTVKLEKTGFQDWTETKTINSGDNHEVNPVMNLASVTPSPSASPISSPAPKPTSVSSESMLESSKKEKKEKDTFLGEVLGTEENSEGKEEKEEQESEGGLFGKLPLLLIAGGIVLLFAANFSFLKPKIQDIIDLIKYKAGPSA